jgi:hypothetical protein
MGSGGPVVEHGRMGVVCSWAFTGYEEPKLLSMIGAARRGHDTLLGPIPLATDCPWFFVPGRYLTEWCSSGMRIAVADRDVYSS